MSAVKRSEMYHFSRELCHRARVFVQHQFKATENFYSFGKISRKELRGLRSYWNEIVKITFVVSSLLECFILYRYYRTTKWSKMKFIRQIILIAELCIKNFFLNVLQDMTEKKEIIIFSGVQFMLMTFTVCCSVPEVNEEIIFKDT